MKYIYVNLILMLEIFLLCKIHGSVIPRFDASESNGIIFEPIVPRAGQKLVAECRLTGISAENVKSVSWKLKRFNDGKEFYIATNNNVFQFLHPTQRLFAYHEIGSNKWSIKFDPLDRDDIGNLTCWLSDTGGIEVSLTRFLAVHSDPVILESSSKDLEVNLNSTVRFLCQAQGYPSPSVYWIRADNKPFFDGSLIHRSEIIKINHVKKEDRGIYICLASNLIGNGEQRVVSLSVKFPPKVECQTSVGQAPNFEVDAYLECYVFGYPPPRIVWYKDKSIPITESYKYKFEATIPELDICRDCILARITIINIVAGDYGVYVIEATSPQFPSELSQGKVKLYETPECQQSITNTNGKSCKNQ